MNKSSLRKWLLIFVGITAVGLGILGIVVPVLPTTPFMLLAAGCFIRSSPKLYTWLTKHKVFGTYIKHYHEYHAITLPMKIVTLFFLWGVIGATILWAVTIWWMRLLLIIVAVAVTTHIIYLKTLTKEMLRSQLPALENGDD